MSQQSTKSGPEWIAAFAQAEDAVQDAAVPVRAWAKELMAQMTREKPDQEFHLLGISRVAKTPSFLLASSAAVAAQGEAPHPIHPGEKAAGAFFVPTQRGVRVLREELPIAITFSTERDPDARRHEATFYDAICFDTKDFSIVLGIEAGDADVDELFTNDEVLALSKVISQQGIPLLESHVLRVACAERDEELNLVSRLVRAGAVGDLSPMLLDGSSGRTTRNYFTEQVSQDYFEYVIAQWRQSWNDVRQAMDSSLDDMLSAMEQQDRMIRNLANICALLQPQVKPQIEIMGTDELINNVRDAAEGVAARCGIELTCDNQAATESIAVDGSAVVKLCEKMLDYHLVFYPSSCVSISMVVADGADGVDFVALRIEDDGSGDTDAATPSNLRALDGGQPMRLRNGGGILYLLGSLLLQKGGGRFRLRPMETGYCAELLLPRARR